VSWSINSSDNRPIYPQNRSDSIFDNPENRRDIAGRISADEATRFCQDAVRQEAAQRFNRSDIEFRGVSIEDNPGRRDLVAGTFITRNASNVNGNYGRQNVHRFSCSMNLNNGRLQAVEIDQQQSGGPSVGFSGDRVASYNTQAMASCERAVQD